ncbi:hypothetical protein LTS01_026076, partial [Friedmanniomyces endolithicus]
MRHELRLHHPARLVLATPPLAQHSVDFVNEDDTRLQLPREGEHGGDEFIAVAVPFLRERGDVQIDEAGAAFAREGFGEHGFAAAGGAVEEDSGGGGEEGG